MSLPLTDLTPGTEAGHILAPWEAMGPHCLLGTGREGTQLRAEGTQRQSRAGLGLSPGPRSQDSLASPAPVLPAPGHLLMVPIP